MQTIALLQTAWPSVQLLPEHVVTFSAAEARFQALLKEANSRPQLEVLGQLLSGPWQNGHAFVKVSH